MTRASKLGVHCPRLRAACTQAAHLAEEGVGGSKVCLAAGTEAAAEASVEVLRSLGLKVVIARLDAYETDVVETFLGDTAPGVLVIGSAA